MGGESVALAACPFCGIVPSLRTCVKDTGADDGHSLFAVQCQNEKCTVKPGCFQYGPSHTTGGPGWVDGLASDEEAKTAVIDRWNSQTVGKSERQFPLEFQPQCHQFRWMLDHLGGWQFGEQDLIPAILDALNLTSGWCIEYGAGDGVTLPLTIDRICKADPSRCILVEIDSERRRSLWKLYQDATISESINWSNFDPDTSSIVVIDIDSRDSVVMRQMLDAGCRPALIVCEHMDRHYSIGTTLPNPIPEWLLGTITEHGHAIQDTAETLQWIAGKYGYERIGLNRCNSFFVRSDLFPLLFR
jgi:hypothetical protein